MNDIHDGAFKILLYSRLKCAFCSQVKLVQRMRDEAKRHAQSEAARAKEV